MSLTKLISQIEEDANKQVTLIIEDAQRKAQEIIAAAIKDAEKQPVDFITVEELSRFLGADI